MNGEWLRWYSLIYWLPAAVAVLVLLLSGLGGVDDGQAGGAEGEFGEFGAALQEGLAFLGAGHAPLMVVVGSLMLGWGVFGLAGNAILQPWLGEPARFMLPSLAIATVGSLL